MSALFTPPRYSPMSGNGTSYPGAKLYFYETGTTTPKDTYNDPDLDPAHVNANPVVADANGLFGVIYLASGEYKVLLKDASDNTLWTVDPQSGLGAADSLTARGDLLTRDASGYARLAIGAANYVLTSNGTDPVWSAPVIPRLAIQGLTYANNVSDATNDIDIAVGSAMDSTSARMMLLETALTKRLDAPWAVGNNAGGLDTGSAADTDYYIWLIQRSDTGVVDILFSTSATAPTMPTDYNYRRRVGWFRRASGAIVAFNTYELEGGGLEFAWKSIATDVTETIGTARSLVSLDRVPSGLSVVATISIESNLLRAVNVCCPDQTDIAPAFGGGIGVTGTMGSMSSGSQVIADLTAKNQIRVRTNTSGEVAIRASASSTTVYAAVIGFEWGRR